MWGVGTTALPLVYPGNHRNQLCAFRISDFATLNWRFRIVSPLWDRPRPGPAGDLPVSHFSGRERPLTSPRCQGIWARADPGGAVALLLDGSLATASDPPRPVFGYTNAWSTIQRAARLDHRSGHRGRATPPALTPVAAPRVQKLFN